jgi:hypothetical protein
MATALAFLQMFGLDKQVETLRQDGVHSLRNILTLSVCIHRCFEEFGFWLEHVPGEKVDPAPNNH